MTETSIGPVKVKRQHRIVTRHVVERTALKELSRLWGLQAASKDGDLEATAELERLGITARSELHVRHERKRFYKWACATPA